MSRRSLLRTGAHALWVVPALQVASLASSTATSGSPTLSVSVHRVSKSSLLGTGTVTLDVTAAVTGGGSVTGLQVVLANAGPLQDQKVFRPGALLLAATRATVVNSPGWTTNPANGEGPYIATYLGGTDGGVIQSGESRTVRIRFDNCNTNPDFKIKVTPNGHPSTDGVLVTSPASLKPFG